MALLELRDVAVSYGPIQALKNVSLVVERGEHDERATARPSRALGRDRAQKARHRVKGTQPFCICRRPAEARGLHGQLLHRAQIRQITAVRQRVLREGKARIGLLV